MSPETQERQGSSWIGHGGRRRDEQWGDGGAPGRQPRRVDRADDHVDDQIQQREVAESVVVVQREVITGQHDPKRPVWQRVQGLEQAGRIGTRRRGWCGDDRVGRRVRIEDPVSPVRRGQEPDPGVWTDSREPDDPFGGDRAGQ